MLEIIVIVLILIFLFGGLRFSRRWLRPTDERGAPRP